MITNITAIARIAIQAPLVNFVSSPMTRTVPVRAQPKALMPRDRIIFRRLAGSVSSRRWRFQCRIMPAWLNVTSIRTPWWLVYLNSSWSCDVSCFSSDIEFRYPFKLSIKTLPKLTDVIGGKVQVNDIRSLSVEDLLARPPVGLDPVPVRHLIRGRRVMVTGAGGSIGSELCRQIIKLNPASLVMFERYENSLHAVRLELEDRKPACGLHAVVGDVGDTACVSAVMQQYHPEIVFHAAAHKHVPLMEESPCEAIKNNVRGTRLLAQAAQFFGVDRFIFISPPGCSVRPIRQTDDRYVTAQ